jgi:hypothetical protein
MRYTNIDSLASSLCLVFGMAILFVSIMPEASLAQNAFQIPTDQQIVNSNWEQRREAFALLIGVDPQRYLKNGVESVNTILGATLETYPQAADQRTLKLIKLLGVENQEVSEKERLRVESGLQQLPEEDRFSEEYVNYFGDVVAAVAMLHDPRSVDVMLGAITTGGMATSTLISFGPLVVEPVVDLFATSDSLLERSSAIRVLSALLTESASVSSDPISRSAIKDVLIRAAADESFVLRSNAVVGLVRLGDDDSIAIVERIAETDPYQADFADNRFVVREAARKALNIER